MTEPTTTRVLLLPGNTRLASSNVAALRTAAAVAPSGMDTVLYDQLSALPAFNPDHEDPLPPASADLRAQLAAADAVLICTPEYAHALPGSFKNLLDWTVGGGQLTGKPVAWLNISAEGKGEPAHESLAMVLTYLRAEIVEKACGRLPLNRDMLGDDGTVAEPAARATIASLMRALQDHLTSR
ncbi:MAG TPA: NADPH-dependent FMN reductase [Actinophytocola sp.]|nr:NADPH-dependent FMN reductase [Actinophytocola sp.]